MPTEPAPDETPETGGGPPETPDRRPFTQFLHEQRRGGLHAELSETLAEVVDGVMEHGKQGTVTLKLTIAPANDGAVFVADEVKASVPEGDKEKSLFFADSRGNLSRRDPRQSEIPGLREAPKPATTPREVE